jgi:hypothetical protein
LLGGFKGGDLRQADNTMLGRHVGRFEGRRDEAVRRSNINNATPLLGFHDRDRHAHGVKGARKIDRQDLVPLLSRECLDRGDVLDASVVNQNVNVAERGSRGGDEIGNLIGLGCVGAVTSDRHAITHGNLVFCLINICLGAETIEHDVAPAQAIAIPSPMPLVDPVTIAVRPTRKRLVLEMEDLVLQVEAMGVSSMTLYPSR